MKLKKKHRSPSEDAIRCLPEIRKENSLLVFVYTCSPSDIKMVENKRQNEHINSYNIVNKRSLLILIFNFS